MRHYIIEDSSFVVGLLDKNDKFHPDAREIFKIILNKQQYLKAILPSVVIYETITALLRKGYPYTQVERKIWNLLHIDELIVVNLPVENAFRVGKRLPNNFGIEYKITTLDWLIVGCGIDFEGQILTFDYKLVKRVKKIYPYIYYCSGLDKHENETSAFLQDLNSSISCVKLFLSSSHKK